MALADLSSALWREREVMDLLLYKLECQQHALLTGRPEWLVLATKEVDEVIGVIGDVALRRAMLAQLCAEDAHLSSDSTLAELAAVVEEPWSGILTEHRSELLLLARRLEGTRGVTADLLAHASRAARSFEEAGFTGASLDDPGTYAPRKGTSHHERHSALVDGSL